MEFHTYSFVFIFLPLVLLVYHFLRSRSCANWFLAGASFVFYGLGAWWFLIPLAISAIVDYTLGWRMGQTACERQRRRLVIISVVANISILSIFKYTTWLTGSVSDILAPQGIAFVTISLTLPPGISFYTFQTMSYTIDIYRRQFEPTRSFRDYLSFVSFFPQLVAGPIERASRLLPQLAANRPPISAAAASSALFLILFGLFQKTVLADNFGGLIDRILLWLGPNSENPIEPGLGLVFMYAFAFQIYCDFAAYSNIARGTARLFGIELMRNFRTPYLATNPSDFWSRWHISLSTWLRDYLYIPLGGNRGGRWLTMRNLIITMGLGGLWHGAGLLFLVWGLWHGLLLVLYSFVPLDRILERNFGKPGRLLSIIIFFHLVCIGWIFFRVTPEQFWPIVHSILAFPGAFMQIMLSTTGSWLAVFEGDASAPTVFVQTLQVLLSSFYRPAVLGWAGAWSCFFSPF